MFNKSEVLNENWSVLRHVIVKVNARSGVQKFKNLPQICMPHPCFGLVRFSRDLIRLAHKRFAMIGYWLKACIGQNSPGRSNTLRDSIKSFTVSEYPVELTISKEFMVNGCHLSLLYTRFSWMLGFLKFILLLSLVLTSDISINTR